MTNPRYAAILEQRVAEFVHSFVKISAELFEDLSDEQKTYIHTGEFGTYREALVRRFLGFFTPPRLGLDTGFLMTSDGGVSTQCDVIVYDKTHAPSLTTPDLLRFFPVEGVVGVGEVKSKLDATEYKKALRKLATVAALRDQVPSPVVARSDPARFRGKAPAPFAAHPYDQMVSFLVCERLDFPRENLIKHTLGAYDGLDPRHRHNLVLSVSDGLVLWVDHNDKTMYYPVMPKGPLAVRAVLPTADNKLAHFSYFTSYYAAAVASATVFFTDLVQYMPTATGGQNLDQRE